MTNLIQTLQSDMLRLAVTGPSRAYSYYWGGKRKDRRSSGLYKIVDVWQGLEVALLGRWKMLGWAHVCVAPPSDLILLPTELLQSTQKQNTRTSRLSPFKKKGGGTLSFQRFACI